MFFTIKMQGLLIALSKPSLAAMSLVLTSGEAKKMFKLEAENRQSEKS